MAVSSPFRTDRHSYHLEIGPQLRAKQDAKRTATALKKAEKFTTKVAAAGSEPTVTADRPRPQTDPQDSDVDEGLLVGENRCTS